MYTAAKRQNPEESGYSGGLVHDETKIQEGLVLSMEEVYPNLIGWVDTGEKCTGMNTNVFRKNTNLRAHRLCMI